MRPYYIKILKKIKNKRYPTHDYLYAKKYWLANDGLYLIQGEYVEGKSPYDEVRIFYTLLIYIICGNFYPLTCEWVN